MAAGGRHMVFPDAPLAVYPDKSCMLGFEPDAEAATRSAHMIRYPALPPFSGQIRSSPAAKKKSNICFFSAAAFDMSTGPVGNKLPKVIIHILFINTVKKVKAPNWN